MTLNVKELLAKIVLAFSDYLVVETKTQAISFSNQRYKYYSVNVAKNGYTPIGLVGWSTGSVDWLISQYFISGNTATVHLFRTASATTSTTFTLHVLYRKNI